MQRGADALGVLARSLPSSVLADLVKLFADLELETYRSLVGSDDRDVVIGRANAYWWLGTQFNRHLMERQNSGP